MFEFCAECGQGPRDTYDVPPINPAHPPRFPRACLPCVMKQQARWTTALAGAVARLEARKEAAA